MSIDPITAAVTIKEGYSGYNNATPLYTNDREKTNIKHLKLYYSYDFLFNAQGVCLFFFFFLLTDMLWD